jgi:hypothetical protein
MAPTRLTECTLRLVFGTFALAILALLGGCGGGSGAPNNPFAPGPVAPGPLSILPAAPTVYSNTPATLTITGGVPPYFVVSSNVQVLPLGASVTNGTIVLLPANVLSATAVVITAQDSAGTKTQATVTVQPSPIFNTLTITPASTACGVNTLCSGQSGTASVTVTGPGGVGIAGRQVRFDVVSGAFAIQTTDPAHPLVSTLTVVSDQFGVAQAIIVATAGAPTQPAQLRATELTTGNQQTAQFTIVQTINGSTVLSVVPSTVTITGPDTSTCSSGFRTDYFIYGGTPPYRVTSTFPNSVILVNPVVLASGQPFTAITNGSCVNPLVFSIVDAVGLQTTATLINNPGTSAPPTNVEALQAFPPTQNVAGCSGKTISELITGGTPPYNITVQVPGAAAVPTIAAPSTPGYALISGFDATVGVYNFFVADSGATGSTQQTTTFKINCT